jgi:hypothetical protein
MSDVFVDLLDGGLWLLRRLFPNETIVRDRARWAGGMLGNPLVTLTLLVIWLGDLLRRACRYFYPRSDRIPDLELGLKKTQ